MGKCKKGWDVKMEVRKIYAFIIATLVIAVVTAPLIWAATEDSVVITFNPEGAIDIDVFPASYDFGDVLVTLWSNTTGNYFTLYNNGTVPMDTQVKSNASTEEGDMYLNASGLPGLDNYSLITANLNADGYMDSNYGADNDSSLAATGSKTFGICLRMGATLSANHTQQTTTIFFQGSEAN